MRRVTRGWTKGLIASMLVLYTLSLLLIQPAVSHAEETTATTPPKMIGYFTAWGIYDRNYRVKNIVTSGSAPILTHINYAFSNVKPVTAGGQVTCQIGDSWADYEKSWTAAESVDGVAVPWGAPLRGNFQQLKALKAKYPNIKVLISLGGWSWSQYFSSMSMTPASRTAFVTSCIDLFIKGNLPQSGDAGGPGAALGVFDGIDIDWEFPGVCGNTCDFHPQDGQNFTALLTEFRRQLNAIGQTHNKRYELTIATSANPTTFAKLELTKIHPLLDFINVMSYDIHGTFEPTTNFQAPLYPSTADPAYAKHQTVSEAIQGYLNGGVPAAKLVMGVPFYSRGWSGVPATNNGLYQTSTGAAPGKYEAGIDDYKEIKAKLAAGGFTRYFNNTTKNAWLYNPTTRIFWTYDDVPSQQAKATYAKSKNLGGLMFWDLSGDTADGELIKALKAGLGTVIPAPTLTSISPVAVRAGSPAFTLIVRGTGFQANSIVRWNGANRTTTFVNATQIRAAITAADIAAPATPLITVVTPSGGTSSPLSLTINSLITNGGFEIDANADGKPDNWSAIPQLTRAPSPYRSGLASGRLYDNTNATFGISQNVAVQAGKSYNFSGYVRIPTFTDSNGFSFIVRVVWRNSSNATIGTPVTIKTYTTTTGTAAPWNLVSRSGLVAPNGSTAATKATSASIQLVATSLKGVIYLDDFNLR